jgi:hypothetical protein
VKASVWGYLNPVVITELPQAVNHFNPSFFSFLKLISSVISAGTKNQDVKNFRLRQNLVALKFKFLRDHDFKIHLRFVGDLWSWQELFTSSISLLSI